MKRFDCLLSENVVTEYDMLTIMLTYRDRYAVVYLPVRRELNLWFFYAIKNWVFTVSILKITTYLLNSYDVFEINIMLNNFR